ncbi:putative proliferation-associated protein 2G4 [Toxoplasma gondii RUB]|uniref:Proliferation-associated protein 2G4, putative n=11 Tax=Toxoplasma gondii TaxID=5811 RepID=B9QP72_TOXGV|nr:putative proliferation-associated protein 2G4 [Toxoplasma gondii GT1]ESS33456.1 putative proliferation-associated protein 2G4 [Toxoplasma gondii VEG]KAF4644016.1 putative proliferation-associated protein 2G4 [Toxoplasma gondii]KFG29526.1 putative proliferation-associated protein 2G4 [Toxoplasma gondii p89]KFG38993.1 putative proliferation-associated protein 2G4 [Toxoplasma gondii GAB2-2007-GAL-DOM2]KFG42559.1 putative proliferation-associated protein 2G4 [Toxoplasma gondii FOU]KFG58991.1 p
MLKPVDAQLCISEKEFSCSPLHRKFSRQPTRASAVDSLGKYSLQNSNSFPISSDIATMADATGSEVETEVVQDLSNPDVVTKYRTAADIVNGALKKVICGCVPGADVYALCKTGDTYIVEACSKVYNKKENGKKMEKGIAFPTCISINEICGHFSPVEENAETDRVLAEGDVVKVDLGCHIDGYIAVVAYTVVCDASLPGIFGGTSGAQEQGRITGRKADVIKACWTAAEACMRLVKAGHKSTDLTKTIELAAKQYGCTPLQGVLSHQLKRYVIEGSKCFADATPGPGEDEPEEFEFEPNEVYGVDIVISSGEGKAKDAAVKPTVYKRAVDRTYILKSQLGRHFMSEVQNKYPTLPFSLRGFSDDRACKVGVAEAMRHELLHPYPVMTEKPGEYVAQFKFTLLLLPTGTKKVTGLPLLYEKELDSIHTVEDESLKALLAVSVNPKKLKKKAQVEKREDANNA